MAYNEYTYRMKPVVIPGVLYLILNPACLIALDLYLRFDRLFLVALYGIYGVTAVAIFIIWAIAGSRKIVFDEHSIVLSDLFTKKVFNPNNIQRATFLW
ncbi:MAG: hypothetical protein LBB49_03305, partial [Gracilibacteraceae bacterium]|nr:hypothetical protein [Gracilibacteraceae bacterium]